jgi:hypothetical protein
LKVLISFFTWLFGIFIWGILAIIATFGSCVTNTTNSLIGYVEENYEIKMPNKVKVVFDDEVTFIDGEKEYSVSAFTEDYVLKYDVQLTTDYHDMEYVNSFSIENKFSKITEVETGGYLPDFSHNIDWVGFEHRGNARFNDLYILVDYDESLLYIYKDVHQW